MASGHGGKRPNQTGRPVGSRNKATAPVRDAIESQDPIGKLFKLADETENEDIRKSCLLGLLPYAYPRLSASQIDLKAALMGDTTLVVELSEPKQIEAGK